MALLTGSFPKHVLDEVFPRPPLREVAFEIRFSPRLRVNAELWKIQDELVDDYPALSVEQLLQSNGTVLNVNVFQNPNAARAIKISQENFVVAFTKYTRFEDFKEEVINRVKEFCMKFEVASLARVGLRYVNNIVLPASDRVSDLLRYVRPVIDFERVAADSVDQFVSEVRMRQKNHMVTLRGALLTPLEDGRRIYVLDIDCHGNTECGADRISALLDGYHETAQLFFLDHVTDEYKNVMRGKS
jgi:uncharacterized protein (TIGR04255 family)